MPHDNDLYADFARGLLRSLDDFNNPDVPTFRKATPIARGPDTVVILAVRRGRLCADEIFEHSTRTVSRLLARIEAEKAARAQGYTVGYVVDYRTGGGS